MTEQEKVVQMPDQIDFNAILKDIDGEDMEMRVGGTDDVPEMEVMTLGSVCVRALINAQEGDNKLDGPKKLAYFSLAQKIRGKGDAYAICKLSSEEKVDIKKRAAVLWPITVYARINEAFEE